MIEDKKEAANALREMSREYQWDGPEKDMKAMYVQDRKNFREVASLIRKGDFSQAMDKASRMDTAAREHIPPDVWDFLVRRSGYVR